MPDALRHLVIDTSLFSPDFQQNLLNLLSSCYELDDATDGVLIHADNFQALNLLQARYQGQVKCIYIDPPYNTGGDGFIYKDGYHHSSWLSLMENRLQAAYPLLSQDGVNFISIDDNEQAKLKQLCDGVYGEGNFVADLIWQKKNVVQNDAKFFSTNHEYLFCYTREATRLILNRLARSLEQKARYKNPDNDPRGVWASVALQAKSGSSVYEITFPNGVIWKPVEGTYPRLSKDSLMKAYNEGRLWFGKNGTNVPRLKKYLSEVQDGVLSNTIWTNDEVGSTQLAKETLKGLLNLNIFDTPKPVDFIKKMLRLACNKLDITLDYFAGSGTTAHAVINLNREDGGKRQYILVEQGEYFNTVLKPRVQKVIYSENWKNGKPQADKEKGFNGVSQIVKVLKLESYEDTLNNLSLQSQGELFNNLPEKVQEDYLLRYMLDTESKGSLLTLEDFRQPFDYQMKISCDSAGAYQVQKIDLIETFNYLLGAKLIGVNDQRIKKGFVGIECRLPSQSDDEKTLIFWRDCERVDYQDLQELFDRLQINPANSEYSRIYINGDHTLDTIWEGDESGSLKILSIEEAFLSLMFTEEA